MIALGWEGVETPFLMGLNRFLVSFGNGFWVGLLQLFRMVLWFLIGVLVRGWKEGWFCGE